ncbi:MAG TPA: phosphonoacetaldehyde reductase [Paludibacter sp.]|nr:phosphonoacetaldehyde reductase [Paludibacter sp.]
MRQEFIGFDSIKYLDQALSQYKARKIFLVRGKESFKTSGAESILKPFLAGYSVDHFICNEPNPKIEDIERGIEVFKTQNPDVVIACGGGSIIDTAKLISFFGTNNIAPQDWFCEKTMKIERKITLIAIPTTAGSGSEATQFAVLYIGNEKHSIDHPTMLSDTAIIDPVFTMNLPPYITASSGMDALSQAIESYWNINSTDESKVFAAYAIGLIYPNIVEAVNDPKISNRLAMAEGAHWAGKAINLTRTTAVHAISYPITSYFGIPHGHACGLILPEMFHYIAGVTENDLLDKRGKEYVLSTLNEIAQFMGENDRQNVPKRIYMIMKNVGLETNFKTLGIKSENDMDTIINHGFNPARVKNNPRLLTKENLKHLLHAAASVTFR